MKRVFLAASLLIAATTFVGLTGVNAATETSTLQKKGVHIPPSQVPPPVMATFNTNFPTATNVRWQREKEHGSTIYQADFLLNGQGWRATFASDGTMLSSGPR